MELVTLQLFVMEADPEVDIMLLNAVQGIRRVNDVVGKDGLRVERSARIIPRLAPTRLPELCTRRGGGAGPALGSACDGQGSLIAVW